MVCAQPPKHRHRYPHQTTLRFAHADNLSSLDALLKALSDLDDLCVTIDEAYQKNLQEARYERWNEES